MGTMLLTRTLKMIPMMMTLKIRKRKRHEEYEQEESEKLHMEDLTEAQQHLEECAIGTQCLDADMKCKNLGTEFCIAEDQFSCAPAPVGGCLPTNAPAPNAQDEEVHCNTIKAQFKAAGCCPHAQGNNSKSAQIATRP